MALQRRCSCAVHMPFMHMRFMHAAAQVELCFTGEGDDKAPRLVSLRGLDHSLYYRPNGLLNLAVPAVAALVRAALRHWTTHHSLDGFVLLSAEAMAQSADGTVLDAPPLAQVLCPPSAAAPALAGLASAAVARGVRECSRGTHCEAICCATPRSAPERLLPPWPCMRAAPLHPLPSPSSPLCNASHCA
jgi:hypothetical protein